MAVAISPRLMRRPPCSTMRMHGRDPRLDHPSTFRRSRRLCSTKHERIVQITFDIIESISEIINHQIAAGFDPGLGDVHGQTRSPRN